jgi:two-component system sensor histidine kinase KdpD
MGESLAQELDLDKVIEAISDCGLDLTEAEAAIFLYRDDDVGKEFLEPTQARRRLILSAANPIVRQVMEGALVYNPDDAAEEGGREDAPKSVLGIPIRSRSNEIEGGLFLLHSRPNAFEESHQRLAMGLARWSSIVLENAKLYGQSQELLGEVQKANQDKDEVLAVVSHELRTPITTIYGGTRLMRIRRDQLSAEAMDDMIVSVAEESERLYRLVEDLLAIARTEMSEGVEREPVSITAVAEQSVAQLHRLSSSRPVEVRIADDLPAVSAEPSYLVHVVYNLISNADKYAPEGQPIEIEAVLEDAEVVLRDMDRGPGVAPDQLDQIFDSFYRTKDATERASGKGLGLTVCKRLVEALSGRIWAQNRLGGGLEVTVVLEVAEPNAEAASGEN